MVTVMHRSNWNRKNRKKSETEVYLRTVKRQKREGMILTSSTGRKFSKRRKLIGF